MSELQPQSTAVGIIFPYPEPVNEDKLQSWFEGQGFEVHGLSQGISIGPQGLQVGSGNYASKDDLQILFNPNANLDGLANSSFITVKDPENANLDRVLDEANNFWSNYDEMDVSDEAVLVEWTYEGRVEIDKNQHDFSGFFETEYLSALTDAMEVETRGIGARFQANLEPTEIGWYRFILDSQQVPNPRRWAFKLQQRLENPNSINEESTVQIIESFVDRTQSNGE